MKNKTLTIIAFTVPLLLVVIVALAVYWPTTKVTTDYQFLYTKCDDNGRISIRYYSCSEYMRLRYVIEDNQLILKDVPMPSEYKSYYETNGEFLSQINGRLFIYDPVKKASKEITLQEAQSYQYYNLATSPDGVEIKVLSESSRGFFLFYDGGSYDVYLTKGNDKTDLNIFPEDYYDYYYVPDIFRFIGWVE
jgi:hypothetical protein